jgi:alpha-tubulin suppressor-like RCC1 family protein
MNSSGNPAFGVWSRMKPTDWLRPRALWLALALLNLLLPPAGARADTAPAITGAPSSLTVNVGQAATFTVTATGSPLNYQWYKNGVAISGATSASFSLASTVAADAGAYTVTVSNAAGTVRTYNPFGNIFCMGAYHSLYVKTDGTLWASGYNYFGELGDGTNVNHYAPEQVATGVAAVAAGYYHSLFLKTDGTLWVMGSNGNGQLGDGTTTSRNTPVQIATGVAAVAAGASHSLFLKTDGTLWGMGSNSSGQLGDGTSVDRLTPVQIASGVASMAAGGSHTLFVKTDGALWGTGSNYYGQLGDGTSSNHYTPFQIASGVASASGGDSHSLFLKTDGSLWGMGSNGNGQIGDGGYAYYRFTPVQVATGVTAASAGGYHSLFLKTDGTLWGAGYNYYGQLGDSTLYYYARYTPSQIAAGVSAVRGGTYGTLFVKTDGTLWATGMNNYGQLGDGTSANRSTPVPIFCAGDSLALLTVVVPPTITIQPQSQTVTAGGMVGVSVSASGSAPFTYQWKKDGVEILNATGPMYAFEPFTIGNTGSYTCTVTNAAGSVTSNAAVLSLSVPLVAGQAAVTGKATSFLATTGGVGDIRWQVSTDGGTTWTDLADDATYAGTATTQLNLLAVTPAMNSYLYRYTVTGNNQTVRSSGAKLTVFTSPLTMPVGIVGDKAGNLFVSDAANQTLLKVDPDLKLSVVAGKNGVMGKSDGTGTAALFNEPGGVISFDDGSLLLADTSNNAIRAVSAQGAVTTLAGGTLGNADGDGPAAQFNAPLGLSADLAGVYLVADQANHVIRMVTGTGRVATLAGKAGIPGTADGTGSSASFNLPTGIITRRDQYNYYTWTGGSNGYGTIFVSDQGSNTIRAVQSNGQVATYVGTPSQAGTTDSYRQNARFNKPTGLTMDGDGNLYVADTGNHTIRKVDTWGNVTTLAGSPGASGLMDGTGRLARFNAPEALTFGRDRNLYVADTGNGVIRKVTMTGVVTTLSVLGNVPVINTQPASLSVTTGTGASFTVAATGEGTLTYQWRKNGAAITGATSATYSIATTTAGDAANYTVDVTNSWGTTTSATAALTVNTPPPPPPSSGGGGGGGAPSPLFLLLLGAAGLLQRLRGRRA